MATAKRNLAGKSSILPPSDEIERIAEIIEKPTAWVRKHLKEIQEIEMGIRKALERRAPRPQGQRRLMLVEPAKPLSLEEVEEKATAVANEEPVPEDHPQGELLVEQEVKEWESQSLDLSNRVLAALFYSGGKRKVNLSESELVETLKDFLPAGANISTIVSNTLAAMQALWGQLPRGDESRRQFIRTLNQFRKEYGQNCTLNFDNSISRAMREDLSGDPVDLG